ncbi:MAG TPA: glycosyltransferase family 39 protein, partial [Pyrinomonadaceae bacterium]|nr:glycosyltransferase family 39 protein [Pyrinomonadaceae bacterium]
GGGHGGSPLQYVPSNTNNSEVVVTENFGKRLNTYQIIALCFLLIVLSLQLFLSVRRESQTWDEGNHIFTGYRSWTHGDYGLNPEHPPLVKLFVTIPLLWSQPKSPTLEERFFKEDAFLRGKEFLYQNDAGKILARTRTGAAILTLITALVVFFGTREMFGTGAAFIALTLLTFDPNLLAHGALITTDVGLACFMFLSVYLFYRFVKSPSALRLIATGLSVGLVLAVKHTGLLVLPILCLLVLCEIVRNFLAVNRQEFGRQALRIIGSLALIILIGWIVLWSTYRFRYDARPSGLQLNPPLVEYVKGLEPYEAWPISVMARFHILPESYLYGLADVKLTANYYTSYLLGKVYAHGVWFYFPVAFLIKSTIGVLLLLLLSLGVVATRRLNRWREIVFLLVPVIFYLIVALTVGMNIGVRHILVVYVFLYVLIGGAAWALIERSRKWAYAVAVLLLVHAGSALLAFPNYIAYANELWGGPSQTYKYLTDSNSDWGQQLKSVKQYLDGRGVKECWFLYFAEGVAEPHYYGIPCKPLPTISTLWLNTPIEVPTTIDGPVLISASNLSGVEFGPGSLDPYGQFKLLKPTAVIDRGVFVFDGKFEMPLAAAISKVQKAQNLAQAKQLEQALQEAQAAVALAPDSIQTQLALGDILLEMGQPQQARAAYEKALGLAKTIEPEFQIRSIEGIERRVQSVGNK